MYWCYNNNEEFEGLCTKTTCPAHLGNDKKTPSGCFWLLIGGRSTPTYTELSYALDKPVMKLKEEYVEGMELIKTLNELKSWKEQAAEWGLSQTFCTECGSIDPCTYNCAKIKIVGEEILKLFPFKIKAFDIDLPMLHTLYKWAKKWNKLDQLEAMCPEIRKLEVAIW